MRSNATIESSASGTNRAKNDARGIPSPSKSRSVAETSRSFATAAIAKIAASATAAAEPTPVLLTDPLWSELPL